MRTRDMFQDFINDELARLEWSQRKLAEALDVAPSTVSRLLDPTEPSKPSLEILIGLSKVTGKSLETLIGLAYPDVALEMQLSPSAMLMAQRFEELPDDIQRTILAIMRGWKE